MRIKIQSEEQNSRQSSEILIRVGHKKMEEEQDHKKKKKNKELHRVLFPYQIILILVTERIDWGKQDFNLPLSSILKSFMSPYFSLSRFSFNPVPCKTQYCYKVSQTGQWIS